MTDTVVPVSTVTAETGSGQAGATGSTLANPLVVLVQDVGGNPIAGATVAWTVTTANATLQATLLPPAADGRASTQLVLGNTAGPVTVTAVVAGKTATFIETATSGS